MIVRTYTRRNRCLGRSISDPSFNGDESFAETLSQESSQDILNFPFSSQDSSPWSFDSNFCGSSIKEFDALSLPPRPVENSLQGANVPKTKKSKTLIVDSGEIKETKERLCAKIQSKQLITKGFRAISVPATSTLMEAQEFGEMMEHVDEANFALDGLRPGQPFRIQRSSLLSLLSISTTAQQRRLLRTQGMAKRIFDAILGLSADDSPSNLAAAALFYILTSDGQDENLLDSPSCIAFLLKLLNPATGNAIEAKTPTIGSKLLAVSRDPDVSRVATKSLDSSAAAIISKVEEILSSCKEITGNKGEGEIRPELCAKWIALLTLEKACLSTVSLEDTSGSVRKVGGNFKERLREHGGLDAVFDVTVNCHSILEGILKQNLPYVHELKADAALQSVVLLLKCLKIMENATFLSQDNQSHLLEMNASLECEGSPSSFIGLILSAIKILSGLSLLHGSPKNFGKEKSSHLPNGGNTFCSHTSEVQVSKEVKGSWDPILSSDSARYCSTEKASNLQFESRQASRTRHKPSAQSEVSVSVSDTEKTSNLSVSCRGRARSSNLVISINSNGPNKNSVGLRRQKSSAQSKGSISVFDTEKTSNLADSRRARAGDSNLVISINSNVPNKNSVALGKRRQMSEDIKYENPVDSQDPFAFDEDDLEPTMWDKFSSMRKGVSRTHVSGSKETCSELEDGEELQLVTSDNELNSEENDIFCENSCSPAVEDEDPNLLGDCLLTAVKVLMNLTNDNSVGCQQIAACGGLDTMATLIVNHFPMFDSCLSMQSWKVENHSVSKLESINFDHQNSKRLSDQELDFLVAILGLLVNLVEKDSGNRARLAAATILLPGLGRSEGEGVRRAVIPFLCSIFLANQGAGEAVGEGKGSLWDDEAAVLQGEREAEKMIIEAYAALLLAFLSRESHDDLVVPPLCLLPTAESVRGAISRCLPGNDLKVLVPVLERFVAFHLTLNMISSETHKAVSEVIESCRGP